MNLLCFRRKQNLDFDSESLRVLTALVQFFLVAFLTPVSAQVISKTIDDRHGDSFAGDVLLYSPQNDWTQCAPCSRCETWHDIIIDHTTDAPRTVQFNFTGISLNGICIIPNPTITSTHTLNFMLVFVMSPAASTVANSTIKSDYTLYTASSPLNIASAPTEVADMGVALSAVLAGAIVVGVVIVLVLALVSIILYRRYRRRHKRRLFLSSPRIKDRKLQIDPFLLLPTRHLVSKKTNEAISRAPPNTFPGRSAQQEDAVQITCLAGHSLESSLRSKGQTISVHERTTEGVSSASTELDFPKNFPSRPRREDTVKELRRTIEELKRQQRELHSGLFPPLYSEIQAGPPVTV